MNNRPDGTPVALIVATIILLAVLATWIVTTT